jgi:hypothetical protein
MAPDKMAPTCPRDGTAMRPGIYTAQTFNKLRPGQTTLYPCGPGAVQPCMKCPACGHSALERMAANAAELGLDY